MNFCWILVGGTHDEHFGERRKFALIEYVDNVGLVVSDFQNTCNFWTSVNDFHSVQLQVLQRMLINGKKFLCKKEVDGVTSFGYRDVSGTHEIDSCLQHNIHDQLCALVYSSCLI